MRAVLDTNVLISGLLWRGAPYECLLSAEARLFELILADQILQELREKLVNKFLVPVEETDEIVGGLSRCAELVQISGQSGWVLNDPDDDKFVEAAIVGKADAIGSGDRHLLGLGSVEAIEILTARQFLQRLLTQPGRE